MSEPAPLDLRRLLGTLERHDVAFVVVGGLAAIAHGSRRVSLDLDVVPQPTADNHRRLAAAVDELDVADVTVVDGAFREIDPRDDVDLARSENVTLRTSAGRLDVLNRAADTVPYDELAARAVRLELAGVTVSIAGRDDLVAMKLALGRPKDLQDVADITAHEQR